MSVSKDFVDKYSAQAAGNADSMGVKDQLIKDVTDIPAALASTERLSLANSSRILAGVASFIS